MGNKKQNKIGEDLKNWIKSISISRTFQESNSYNQIALSLIKGFYVLNWTNESYSPVLESISKQITTVTADLIRNKTQALAFGLLETKISQEKLKNEDGK